MKKNVIKKMLFVVVATLGLVFGANAQSSPNNSSSSNAKKIKIGAKAGLNVSSIKVTDEEETFKTKSRTSFHIGLVAEIPVLDKFSFQPELVYSAQGGEITDFEELYKLDYLNLPLLVKYAVTENISVAIGPQIGFLLSAKQFETDDTDIEDMKEYFKGTDFSLNLGVGYTYNNMNFGARYNLGFSDTLNDKGNDEYFGNDFKIKNSSVIQISVGYFFN